MIPDDLTAAAAPIHPEETGGEMSVTTQVPRERLAEYFDEYTKRFLRTGSPEAADVEVLAPDLGDQSAVEGARLLGITYDRRDDALEFELDSGTHRVEAPEEVWTVEEPDGLISALEVVCSDGSRQVVSIKRVGLRRLE
jgi:uncharacterized protein DUF5335